MQVSTEEVFAVCPFGDCLLDLFIVRSRDPLVVEDEHRLAAREWSVVRDGVMGSGMFREVVHVNLGFVVGF
jgi:hypothetical protein